ncbi:Thioredoxin-like fold containing protein [Trema orientale]|uniref:protein-disulfide reductase n=1 Tax=Trema orientale TaxID=63057 RepID=A0A2P5CC76_TREOI|nr:Thioredoxin-like fold containing protein [Trema orientale]
MADGDVFGQTHDLSVLLSSDERDFLIRNNGEQVKTSSLDGKIVGLYFSASWCTSPFQTFTPDLLEFYQEVASKGNFEVVLVSAGYEDYDSFKSYFSKMLWLAIPFSDSDTQTRLMELFDVSVIPTLVIFDSSGNVTTVDGIKILMEYGMDAYPFTREIITSLLDREEEAKRNHFLSFLLTFRSRNYLISNDGNQVPISELEGKTVALYFWPCYKFTPTLIDVYNKLKAKGEKFEIVSIFGYMEEDKVEKFNREFEMIPWLALPFKDKNPRKLIYYFETHKIPTIVIIGPDGKVLNPNATKLIDEYGEEAYPFTPKRLDELVEIDKARQESQTLESLLVSGDRNFVIAKGGSKVPVFELVGKTILFYFISPWCEVCTRFTPKLIETYHEIKTKDDGFEVIFIAISGDQDTFNKLLSSVPWLALPFGDVRKKFLKYRLKIRGTGFIVIGPSGRTATRKPRELINVYGANAYPFTEEHLQHLEEKMNDMAKGWPEKLTHELHAEHELSLTRDESVHMCYACLETGIGWYYKCDQCAFSLHPKCALKKHEEGADDDPKGDGGILL